MHYVLRKPQGAVAIADGKCCGRYVEGNVK